MSYKDLGKFNLHLKSEKHLVNSGLLVIEDCTECGKEFKTQASREKHLLTTRHIARCCKFVKSMETKKITIATVQELENAKKLEEANVYLTEECGQKDGVIDFLETDLFLTKQQNEELTEECDRKDEIIACLENDLKIAKQQNEELV